MISGEILMLACLLRLQRILPKYITADNIVMIFLPIEFTGLDICK